MATWNEGKIVRNLNWNGSLYTLFIEADIEPYEAGQFARIGLEIDGEIVGRPYSLVNPPGTKPLEIYYIEVSEGPLTSRLVKLQPGDSILIAPRANGFLILDEIPQARHLWLMATGTGVGPFLSILDTDKPWQRFEKVVLVYAVRTLSELNYQHRINEVARRYPEQFIYIPFISREATQFAMPGRISTALIDGSLEERAKLKLSPENSQVMLCGNPQMVEDTTNLLLERGLKKHRRKDPGHITVENYW
ncbi:MAG TPA: ferredoxin--NADP reductase [Methylophilaceae bacterium]|nr:ferredoxin--NADP reductase [Methylophilaceae bacterium]